MTPWGRFIRFATLSALGFAILAIDCHPASTQEGVVAIRGARLMTVTDGVIDDGVLVMSGGRITAIGADVPIPAGAQVVEAAGMTVMPGLIDGFTNLGTADFESFGADDDEATDPVTPHLVISDALNPDNRFIPMARAEGVTAVLCAPAEGNLITGQSVLIRLGGSSIEEMVVRPVGIHISMGEAPRARFGARNQLPQTRMGSAALLRQTFVDAQGYADKLALHERKLGEFRTGEVDEDAKEPTPPARNLKLEALLPVLRGETPVIVSADRFDDIHTVLRIAEEFELQVILNRGAETHRVAEDLARLDIPVIWGPSGASHTELESRNGTPRTPSMLAGAAVPFAFQTGSTDNLAGLLEEARTAISNGLAHQDALEALTIAPARMFGVADQLGSLEVGKWADVVIFNGNPLMETASIERVFVGGKEY